jgi:hypothetical protein
MPFPLSLQFVVVADELSGALKFLSGMHGPVEILAFTSHRNILNFFL